MAIYSGTITPKMEEVEQYGVDRHLYIKMMYITKDFLRSLITLSPEQFDFDFKITTL